MKFSPELVDGRIKASPEPLHAQITALAEMMDRLIQSNSAKETTTVNSRGISRRYESPYSEVPGFFGFLMLAPLTTTGYSPDKLSLIKLTRRPAGIGIFFAQLQTFWSTFANG